MAELLTVPGTGQVVSENLVGEGISTPTSVRAEWLRRTRRALVDAIQASDELSRVLYSPGRSCMGPQGLIDLSVRLADARRNFSACVQELPAQEFALQGRTSDGRLVLLTASAQRAGHWQVTRFDSEGVPWGDSQYTQLASAVDDFLREIELRTLGGHEGAFIGIEPATWTDAFKRWFSGSVVVDQYGRALEVYHGTVEVFDTFCRSHCGLATGSMDGREGFFFAANPASAEQFIWKDGEKCGLIIPVYLALSSPAFSDIVLTGSTSRAAALQIRSARAAGHDGMIFKDSDMLGHRGTVYVAFEPQQIKSARANSGRFDPADPSFMN